MFPCSPKPLGDPQFSNIEILAVPTTSLLGTVYSIFEGKWRLYAISVLKNHPEVNTAIKFINAGFQLFGNNFALYP